MTVAARLLALSAFAAALLAPATAAPAGGFYAPERILVPLAGDGTFSDYAGSRPAVDKDAQGREIVRLPATGKNETSLVFTFWRHRQPRPDAWPSGEKARASLTVTSPADITVRTQLVLNAGDAAAPLAGPVLQLAAGQPRTFELPLPAAAPAKPVESLRVHFSASQTLPELAVSDLSVGREVAVALYPPRHDRLRPAAPLALPGRAAPGSAVAVQALARDGRVAGEWRATASTADGRFSVTLDPASLPSGSLVLRAASRPAAGADTVWSADMPFFLYPVLKDGATLPMVAREGRHLLVEGRPWAFAGLNYTRFLLEFSIPNRADFKILADDFAKYGDWGVSVLRVPLHLGMFQPAPGVFPDDPRYLETLGRYKVDPRFFELFDYAVAVAGHHGIRLVLDWHEMPTDPYRYFVGGNNHDKGTDKPGTGIAWLYDPATKKAAEPGDPRFTKAIADTNRWLARRYKGNGNLLGIEAPYNEPHSLHDSADLAWRRITADTVLPIVSEDPARLTFGMPPAWGHSNVLNSVTWLLPDHLSGLAPHHYHGNGPIAVRPDARSRKEPWLARDVAATFDHAFASIALPHSAVPAPVWNGESGEHGYGSLLPEMSHRDASSLMIEAQLFQPYAAGWTGALGWTLTGNPTVYQPLVDIYEQAYRRFAPVYAAGPVDMSRAQVLFVQNVAAVPVANGLNHACVPFARLALDLHLGPVHYMTDDQLLGVGLVQMAVGLEQVEQAVAGFSYKAAIVDTRNLDARALDLLRGAKLPVLLTDDAAKLTAAELARFLKNSGLTLDEKTPSALQLVEGPAHFLVYRRSGEGPARAHPRLRVEGAFELIDEQGRVAFSGTAAALADKGLALDLPKWRTAIYQIRRK